MDMVHKDIDVLLGHLTSGGVDQELKSELMYMRTIFKFQHFIFSGYLGFLGDTITAKILEERLFYSPSCRTSKECMVNYVDSLVSFIIQKGRSNNFHPDTSMGDASKFLDSLLKNLQSIKKATRRCLSTSTLIPSEILEGKLGDLVNSLNSEANTAQQEYSLTQIQALAESAADLCFTVWVKMSDHFLDTDEISHLLYLRNICKERVPPIEIKKASQMVLLDDQILDICKRLELVKGLLMNLPKQYLKQDKTKDLLRQIAALTSKTRYHSLEEDMAVRVNDALHILLKNSNEICLDVRKLLHSGFPLTDDCGMIDSLVVSLNELLDFKADSPNEHEIEKLKTFIELGKKYGSLGKHRERVFKTAYEAAYVIDSMNLNNNPPPYLKTYLSDIIMEANIIYNEILDTLFLNVLNPVEGVKSSKPLSSVVNTPSNENVLGFKKEEEALKEQLLSGLRKLDVISIVGVPGLGKTTLANKIYNDQNVINHFQVRAWCCVSQEYNMTKLLCEIYSQVTEDELTDEMQMLIKENSKAKVTEVDLAEKFSKCVIDKKTRSKVTESDVAEKLHKFLKELKEKKYLIVLDDIWESRAYDEIIRCFPAVENGSRIMLTSRFDEVAHKIKLHSDPHYLPFFTKEESWELLQWKVFRNESCYPELLETGKEISESCRGLPLFIVLVAGLLTSVKKEERLWSKVAKTLSSVASEHEILGLTYEHLPDRLKSCFLFFAAFPENQEIAVSKLVQLWAAEGFIEKIEGKSLEDVAEDYLSNLLSGGLITVSKRRYDGSIISCRVHNTIHEFCLEKAKKECFLMISSSNNQIPMWDMACHRICFNHQDIECHNPLYSWMQWNPSVRTILCTYRRREPHFSKAIDFSQISRRSRLIRVLDLESITVGNTFFSAIEHLPHLRFIAVHTGYWNFVLPPSLGNLHNLETLKIKTENQSVVLPKAILNMVKLRQLDISESFQFGIDEDDCCLKNIQSLSAVVLPNKPSIGAMMIRFPFLRRLKCIIYIGSNKSSPESNEFLDLEKLDQLESLHVLYDGPVERRDLIVFKFPWCLKKLILNGFSLPACEMSKFALIPTLVALKLQNVHFKDHQWDVEECDFPQLKYLKLYNCSIVYWSALTSSFPCLERLILRRCIILKEVPSCFGNIATLEAVEVYRCNSSLEYSVLKIQSEATNRSSPLMIRILKSDDLQIFYSLDANKCSAGVSQLPENVVDETIRFQLDEYPEEQEELLADAKKEEMDVDALSECRKALFESLEPIANANGKRPSAESLLPPPDFDSLSYPKGWLIGKKQKLVNVDVVESMRRIAVQEMNRKDREIDGLNKQLEADTRCLEHLQLDERSKQADVERQTTMLQNQVNMLMDMLQENDRVDGEVYSLDANKCSAGVSQLPENVVDETKVLSVKVIRNKQTGQSERYGFVEFNSHATAEKVLQSYNGTMMPNAEQPFRLNWAGFGTGEKRAADPGSDLSIFVGDLPADVTDALLCETFASRYSSVKGAKVVVDANTGRPKGYGFVRFGDENEKSRAMTEMNGVYCSSRPMRVGVATPKKPSTQQQYSSQAVVLAGGYAANGAMTQASQSDSDLSNTTVFVGGIDSDVTDEDLRQSFCQFGDVISVKIPFGKGCGFVQFANRSSAEDAIQKLNGSVIGKNTVRLSWGRTPANRQQARTEANGQCGGAYYGRQSYGGYGHSMPQNHDQNMYSAGSGYGGAANGDGNHHQPLS